MSGKKILLGHLNSNGDCLFATAIARQIKEVDFPNCHLTWAVNNHCRQTIELNPYVDEIWELETAQILTNPDEWREFAAAAAARKSAGDFDEIFLTQVVGGNEMNYDGGIRSSIYNNYPRPIIVSPQPIVRLKTEEIENVRRFAEKYALEKFDKVILIECGPQSFTSALNLAAALELAREIADEDRRTAIVISSRTQFEAAHPQLFDGSELSFRENAALTHYCHLLIGCGSGISWLTTADAAKNLDKILVINDRTTAFPSMADDHRYFNLPTGNLIEIKSDDDALEKVKRCLAKINSEGFAAARQSFHETIAPANFFYLENQLRDSLKNLRFGDLVKILRRYVKRHGVRILSNRDFLKTFGRLPLSAIRKKTGF